MTMVAGGGATTGTTTATGGVAATPGTTTTTGPGWDPVKLSVSLLLGAAGVIVSLLLYIWHDTTSNIDKINLKLEQLTTTTNRLDTTSDNMATNINNTGTDIKVIQNDIKVLLSKQSNTEIEKSLNSMKEEIMKSIRERPR